MSAGHTETVAHPGSREVARIPTRWCYGEWLPETTSDGHVINPGELPADAY